MRKTREIQVVHIAKVLKIIVMFLRIILILANAYIDNSDDNINTPLIYQKSKSIRKIQEVMEDH